MMQTFLRRLKLSYFHFLSLLLFVLPPLLVPLVDLDAFQEFERLQDVSQ